MKRVYSRKKKDPSKSETKTSQKPKGFKTKKDIPALVKRLGLENLKFSRGARTRKKILGRGSGSGHGKTSTRGSKGQTSRSGRHFYLGFEGGQVPLIRKIPKRGFSNLKFKKTFQIVNLKDIVRLRDNIIGPELMKQTGLVEKSEGLIKVLGEGEISSPVTVRAHAFSKSAKDKIEKAGGKVELINA